MVASVIASPFSTSAKTRAGIFFFSIPHIAVPKRNQSGQFGGGIEIRLTPHIGFMNDFSWNVVDGPDNNFGMVRSGLTFAF
jgi:hypothetical protein